MNQESLLNKKHQELWDVVKRINNCWYQGQPSDIEDYFHRDVVFNSPDFKQQISGKVNCINTYIEFMSSSKVLLYNEKKPVIHQYGETAIVNYDFEMKYEQNGKLNHETGTDVMVFCKDLGHWKVVWRFVTNLQNI